MFGDQSGNPNVSPGAGLKLELKDFAPPELAEGVSGGFLIGSGGLCRFLENAEQAMEERGIEVQLQRCAKKRRRERIPLEQTNSEDDRKFSEDEQKVRAKQLEDDSSHTPSQ